MRGGGERSGVRGGDEARRLEEVRRLARWLDAAFEIPGTGIRIGLDPLIGLVPGLGDLVASALGASIILLAHRLGAPVSVVARMGLNLAVDAIAGVIPVLGDLVDVAYKANLRNARLLEAWMAAPGPARRSSALAVAAVLLGVLAVVGSLAFATWRMAAWAFGEVSRG